MVDGSAVTTLPAPYEAGRKSRQHDPGSPEPGCFNPPMSLSDSAQGSETWLCQSGEAMPRRDLNSGSVIFGPHQA